MAEHPASLKNYRRRALLALPVFFPALKAVVSSGAEELV